jgi:N-acetylmuramic acid 6-phosphate etherase
MAPRSAAPTQLPDDLYAGLPTEQVLAASADLDRLSPLAVVRLMAREERRSVRAVEQAAPVIAAVVERVTAALASGGRLIYAGAGTSGRLAALDAAECPPTFGVRPGMVVALLAGGDRAMRRAAEGAEDNEDEARKAVARLRVSARDVVVGVAASGVTPFVRAVLAEARARGAATALVTCAPAAAKRAGLVADHVIGLEVGPEVLAGSTRLKAGTATKITLNALSTGAMIGLGKCYGPRMVDVMATNAKLRSRARRLIAELTTRTGAAADRLLRAADGSVKVAAVMARLELGRAEAERRLEASGGRLRALLGPPRRRPAR